MSPTQLTSDELLFAERLVEALNLQDLKASELSPTGALFGSHEQGLGLDSIDALEIALMVHQHYGVELRADDEKDIAAFATIRTLTEHVLAQRSR
jgi:acyl carrier protein